MSGNRSKSAFFEGGWVTLSADFRGKGASSTKHCWYQSSRVISLSCGIKISAVRHLVLSQSTHVTDRRTERRTELRLPRGTLKLQDWTLTDDFARVDIAGLDNGGLDIDGLDNDGLDIVGLDIDGLDNDGRMCG